MRVRLALDAPFCGCPCNMKPTVDIETTFLERKNVKIKETEQETTILRKANLKAEEENAAR
ncbi:CLUMA_CG001454, isoform A [Clunio marinus]|uniref:CLUMA_CG001454, isoform A n=1 Tax=Clunio marinus TaxID=568069 RepID=A0A1J1HI25_9DIPT|nr:CLUMA_CG001454, isoform A [Clunio marinus]